MAAFHAAIIVLLTVSAYGECRDGITGNTPPVAYENSTQFLSMDSMKITSRQPPIDRVGSTTLLAS
jgi:hypothetical protein